MKKDKTPKTKSPDSKRGTSEPDMKALGKRAEEQLGYFTFDENAVILALNIRGANMLGIERQRLINKPFTTFIHPDDQDIFFLHRRFVFESGSPQTCEIRIKRKDRSLFYAQLESISVEDIPNQTFRCRTAMSDISLQKRAEEALKKSEKKYRGIFEGANDGIIAYDLKAGKFAFVNKRMCSLTAYPEEELLKLGVRDLHPEEEIPHALDIFNKWSIHLTQHTTTACVYHNVNLSHA